MLKSALFVSCIFALGMSGVIAATGPIDAAKVEPQATAKDVKPTAWAANEVHAAYNAEKQYAIVDVNDRFVIKSSPAGAGGKVQFGFLDGARAKLGTCNAASKLKDGDPRTTWLRLSYTKPDAQGKRQFTLRRTLDFSGHERVYRFTAGRGTTLATLEPGVRVGLDHGLLVYEQATGPIGTSGDTKAVRVTYKLTDKFSEIASSVEMDRNRWLVSTSQASASSTPIYSVNNTAVLAHIPGEKGVARDRAVVANPTRGNGIGAASDAVGLKVSARQPFNGVENLEVSSVVSQSLCIALPCSFDFQCNGTSTSCICHDLDGSGPQLGTCLV